MIDDGTPQIFDSHLKHCLTCRTAILDHVNELAFEEIAKARGITVEEVKQAFAAEMQDLEQIAMQRRIPLEEAVREVLATKSRAINT